MLQMGFDLWAEWPANPTASDGKGAEIANQIQESIDTLITQALHEEGISSDAVDTLLQNAPTYKQAIQDLLLVPEGDGERATPSMYISYNHSGQAYSHYWSVRGNWHGRVSTVRKSLKDAIDKMLADGISGDSDANALACDRSGSKFERNASVFLGILTDLLANMSDWPDHLVCVHD